MTAVRRSLANRHLSRPFPRAGLLLCAKHLLVADMEAGVHPANQNMIRGVSPPFEGLKLSGIGGVFLDVLNSPATFSDERTLQ
jgi:hypothetical protein